jgi:hypothetical protein
MPEMRDGVRGKRVLQVLRGFKKQKSSPPKEVQVRGDSLFAWQALDPNAETGWYLIAAGILYETSPTPLVSSKLDVALMMEEIAIAHGQSTGQLVRLSEFRKQGGTLKSVAPSDGS